MNVKKGASIALDFLLGGVVVFLAYCQISMMVSMNQPENYGVPRLFGTSVLYVVTDSMAKDTSPDATPEQKAESERVGKEYPISHIEPGSGVFIKKVDPSTIRIGDVITFYYDALGAPDTHRVMEIDAPSSSSDMKYVFHTRGDNLHSSFGSWDVSYRDDPVKEDKVLGVVTKVSPAFGTVLKFVSPGVPNGHAAWFVPLLVLVPVSLIAFSTIKNAVKEEKQEKAALEAEVRAAMEKDGKDPSDEAARYLYEEKIAYKRELAALMEKEKAKQRAALKKKAKEEKK